MNELLPIRFDFRFQPYKWRQVTAEPRYWNFNGRFISLVAEMPGEFNRIGNPRGCSITHEHLPPARKPKFGPARLSALKRLFQIPLLEGEKGPIELLNCSPTAGEDAPEHDPYQLRNDFFALKEDSDSLLAFLNRYGAWGSTYFFIWFGESRSVRDEKPGKAEPKFLAPPYSFWTYRASLKSRIQEAARAPGRWFASTKFPILQPIDAYPFHHAHIAYAMEAIELSFTLDFLREIPLALCAREDCRTPFAVTRKEKIFCSEKCARVMVTRRSRAAQKIQKSKG